MSLLRASSRGLLVSLPRSSVRLFATTRKPEWMIQAEQEAVAATNARAAKQGTANDVLMGKLTHEFNMERIGNAVKLEEKLKQLILKANQAKSVATDAKGRLVYSAVRKKALETRQELITQREAAGMVTDATAVVEAAYPIPASV